MAIVLGDDQMPVQTFEPMTKDFATFDCDAHVTEPARIWERAPEHLTRDELDGPQSDDLVGTRTRSSLSLMEGRARALAPRVAAAFPAPCG